jgi:hypothetical protein
MRPTAPQNNTGVSATGGAGSKDGVPNTRYSGFGYGENAEINSSITSGMTMGTPNQSSAISDLITGGSGNPLNTFGSDTDNPEEPITAGVAMGDGPGPEVLPRNLSNDSRAIENRAIVEKYLPILLEGAKVPDAPQTYKQFLNFLMEQ